MRAAHRSAVNLSRTTLPKQAHLRIGPFQLKSGMKCYPLTISDGFSRYLLRCEALQHPDELACKEVFDGLFKEFGLPAVLRTDNGTPFSGRFGFSALSVWWVKLGIQPERIQRGKPTQNGRHERIHRTLQEDIVKHGNVQNRMYLQQRVFDQFRHTPARGSQERGAGVAVCAELEAASVRVAIAGVPSGLGGVPGAPRWIDPRAWPRLVLVVRSRE